MDLSVLKDVRIGSMCALSVLEFMRWWCRNHGVKPIVLAADADGDNKIRDETLEPRHKVFLSHSSAQKDFVEQLCVDLESCDRYPFMINDGVVYRSGRIFQSLFLKLLNSVSLEWWFYQQNFLHDQNGPCWSWWL